MSSRAKHPGSSWAGRPEVEEFWSLFDGRMALGGWLPASERQRTRASTGDWGSGIRADQLRAFACSLHISRRAERMSLRPDTQAVVCTGSATGCGAGSRATFGHGFLIASDSFTKQPSGPGIHPAMFVSIWHGTELRESYRSAPLVPSHHPPSVPSRFA